MQTKDFHYLRENTELNGKYIITKVLGEGGFGIVYAGWDKLYEKTVAIKEFFPSDIVRRVTQYGNDVTVSQSNRVKVFETGKRRFMQEAKTMAKFYDVPNVVNVRDYFEANNTAYIVMDYLDGITVKNFLKQYGRLGPDDVRAVVAPVIQALDVIHAAGYIHRDISPDNIMMLSGNKSILMDFGAARDYSDFGDATLSVLLKPGYAPPEQYQTHGVQGPWTDIYALCATCYKCLTGVTPQNAFDRSLGEDEVKSPSALGVFLPPRMERAILKGMSIASKNRYSNLKDFCDDFYSDEPVNDDTDIDPVPESEPKLVIVPNVAGMPKARAEAVLKELGLSALVSEDYSSRVPSGGIISQGINPGTGVAKGTGILLVVSRGKKKTPVFAIAAVLCVLLLGGGYAVSKLVRWNPSPESTTELVSSETTTETPSEITTNTSSETTTETPGETTIALSNPKKTGQRVTWDCLWFGSYPQTEVVCAGSDEEAALEKMSIDYSTDFEQVSDEEFKKIKNADYDSNGDAVVDGVKYRRIKKKNATYTKNNSDTYYRWTGKNKWHYFKYEPIKWRVLKVDGTKALLLSDVALDTQKYNKSKRSITWEKATLRSWLNSYGSNFNTNGIDYSSGGFLNAAFKQEEQNAIKARTVKNKKSRTYGTSAGNDTEDKCFILSEPQACSTDYGYKKNRDTKDAARKMQTSTYAYAMGSYRDDSSKNSGACVWWLRSPGESQSTATGVKFEGWVSDKGEVVNDTDRTIVPALWIDLTSSGTFSYAGTVCSNGKVEEISK